MGTSYWHRQPQPPVAAVTTPPLRTDVVVIGAGITGLMVATALRRQGHEVVVLEARGIAAGTTGSSTAKVTVLHGRTYSAIRRKRGPEAAAIYARANLAGWDEIGPRRRRARQ